jgi:hypothetical protein
VLHRRIKSIPGNSTRAGLGSSSLCVPPRLFNPLLLRDAGIVAEGLWCVAKMDRDDMGGVRIGI